MDFHTTFAGCYSHVFDHKSALLRSYSAYPGNAKPNYVELDEEDHIIVTPDLPVPVQDETMEYSSQSLIKREEQKQKQTRTRVVKRPDTPEPLETCRCKHNCIEKINSEAQKELFEEFWRLRDRQVQRDYLVDRVKFEESKKGADPKKKYTFMYRDNEYKVCKLVFLHTLNITEKVIRYALINKEKDLNLPCPEQACFNTTLRGGTVIVHEGYRFSRHHVTDAKTRWHCATHKGKGCKAYMYTVDTQIVRINNDHNHSLPKTSL